MTSPRAPGRARVDLQIDDEGEVVRRAPGEGIRRHERARDPGGAADEHVIEAQERPHGMERRVRATGRLGARVSPSGAPTDMPSHRVATDPSGRPKNTAHRNFTDPDSRIMLKNGAFVQAYNAQIVVDAEHQIVLAHGVGNQAPDVEYLSPMVERLLDNVEINASTILLADSGYMSTSNMQFAEGKGLDALIAVGRDQPGTDRSLRAGWAPMRDKMASPRARAAYRRRKVIAEPPFGQIQEARGFRHFSMRGLAKADREWAFVSLVHNVLKLFRAAARKVHPRPQGAYRPGGPTTALLRTV